jgi:cyclopropane fatty-acyl-phospholipid synthase-like methyltransferase
MDKLLTAFILPFLCSMGLSVFCKGQQEQTPPDKEHHSGTNHANEHMHHSDFETLVSRFDDPARDEWQKPATVIALLGDLSGKTVADIGAGSGYFSFRLAKKAQKVIAIDIDQRFLDYINQKNAGLAEKLPIETRLAAEDDPRLAPNEVDIVIIVNTYHHIENRPVYFANVREKLNKNGALIVVDYFKKELPVGPPTDIKLSEAAVIGELKKAGFENITVDSKSLAYQYIIIAR